MDLGTSTQLEEINLDDLQHLKAAEGYIELGMFEDADAELAAVDPSCRALPRLLTLQLCVYAGLQKWDLIQTVAQKMAENFPDDSQWQIWWASAARRAQSLESAKKILLKALETHPNDANIHYNLSCYESRLQHFRTAQRHLARAIQLDSRFQLIAMNDQDLQPLLQSLSKLEE